LPCGWFLRVARVKALFANLETVKLSFVRVLNGDRKLMPLIALKLKFGRRRLTLAALVAVMLTATAFAQSIEPNSPTPVISNEIAGRIAPLDIGDARMTRFFYTFNGLQGDLELTVESYNLDGDIDIFLGSNLRPLTKVTLYAGTSLTKAAKTVYLRREEPLILRVQARTPNDAEGTYRITFGGAFRPADRFVNNDAASSGETLAASPTPTPARRADKKVRRVTSAGARIEEPVVEVAKEEPEKVEETPPAVAPKTSPPARPRPARNRAGTRGNARTQTSRRTSPSTSSGETEKSEAPKTEDSKTESDAEAGERSDTGAEEKPATAKPERARPVRVPRARNSRNTSTARRTTPPAETVPTSPEETPAPPAAPSPRLVLVMRDGETFERDMSSVRRVTVEKGMIVIVSKTGRIERQPMAAVLRMSIEP
jgi:hypothetical protein